MPPEPIREFLSQVSVADVIRLLKVSAPTRLALLRISSYLDDQIELPLSLIYKTLPKTLKAEIKEKAERYVFQYPDR